MAVTSLHKPSVRMHAWLLPLPVSDITKDVDATVFRDGRLAFIDFQEAPERLVTEPSVAK